MFVRKSMIPFTAYDDADYPGWTLAEIKTTGLRNLWALALSGNNFSSNKSSFSLTLSGWSYEVIVKRCTSLP